MRHHPAASSSWTQELTAAQDRAPMAATPWIDAVVRAKGGPGGAARGRAEAHGDSALLALAVVEMADACGDISYAVTRLAGRCAHLLLRTRKEMLSVGGRGRGFIAFLKDPGGYMSICVKSAPYNSGLLVRK